MSIAAVNTRNQFRGTVANIRRGSVVSEVEVQTETGVISAVVTTSSVDLINLQIGEEAIAMFKATDVLIAKVE
jgi:molybdopterin-binding protein